MSQIAAAGGLGSASVLFWREGWMAVRCAGCGRLTRDEAVCEWCQAEISPAAPPAVSSPPGSPPTASPRGPETVEQGGAAAVPVPQVLAPPPAGESEAPREAASETAGEESLAVEWLPAGPWYRDNFTLAILLLILLQFLLTLYLGRLSSVWSVTGFLWLLVGYGVVERFTWSLALPLVLFTLDVALLLFGIGPRERAGLFSVGPLDFLLYALRLGIWTMIWCLREEMD